MDPGHDDKRREDRERTFLSGRAVLGLGLADLTCQVKDLSAQGARLVFPAKALVPDSFELQVAARGLSKRVAVRWREDRVIGVAFAPERRSGDRGGSPSRVEELEAEVAELRRRIAEMADRLYRYGHTETSFLD